MELPAKKRNCRRRYIGINSPFRKKNKHLCNEYMQRCLFGYEFNNCEIIFNKTTIPAFSQAKACQKQGFCYFSFDVRMDGGGDA